MSPNEQTRHVAVRTSTRIPIGPVEAIDARAETAETDAPGSDTLPDAGR